MNELQLALLGAGLAAIAAVWIYNALQERKHRKLAEAIFKGTQDDVLVPARPAATAAPAASAPAEPQWQAPVDERREPGLAEPPAVADVGGFAVPVELDVPVPASTPEPVPEATPASTPVAAANSTRSENGIDDLLPWADPLADCLVEFATPAPLAAGALWAAQSAWAQALSKPLHWLARNSVGEPWTPVTAPSAERYQQWVAALQLVNRGGPVTDADLARFFDGMQQLARQTGAGIELPARGEMLMRAQDLDRFCAKVDVQFGISVVSSQGNAFVGTKLRGVCEAAGLSLGTDGLYHYRNAAGESEFTLSNLGNERFDAGAMSSLATHGVNLHIDVPRVADGTAAFNRLIQVARQLALGLGGTLVDAHRVPLSEPVIATIRGKIGELQAVLAKAGIVAGSARALRLFS